ncbi:MAG: 3-oxoacyl-ACP synthase [Bacteroidetes bacterium]|nr:3-oxoacyl-ACP synthase [Bacteroidota bacterium]
MDYSIKKKLLLLCHDFIEERINNCQSAIDAANNSINEETKSSAGDKYETSREMITQEIKNNSAQLAEAIKQKQLLSQISVDKKLETIQVGCLVITNHEKFFISISAGSLKLNNETYLAISPSSPLGRNLIDKKKGDSVSFNNKLYSILEVY